MVRALDQEAHGLASQKADEGVVVVSRRMIEEE